MTSSTATALAPRPQRRPGGGCDRAPSCLPYIAGMVEEAGVSNAQLLSRLASQAVDSLSGTHYAIADAIDHVPSKPGLYAVYADPETWQELNLEIRVGCPLYVGKAEESLQSRDIRTHFATGRTGSSTVRRSFAALLPDPLGLRGVPRNMASPERPANFGLVADGDQRLTAWMQKNLFLAYWAKPATEVALDDIETAVIKMWQPPLNLVKVDQRLPALSHARRVMADDARTWARERSLPL
jgi:hypothetical protein